MGDFVPSYQNEEERRQIREEKDRKDRKRNIIIFNTNSSNSVSIRFSFDQRLSNSFIGY